MEISEDKLLITTTTNVRVDDLNYGNHLGHTQLVALLHNARALFLNEHKLSELDCFGVGLVLLNLETNYTSQCFFNDEIKISVYLNHFEGAKIEFAYIVTNIATGKAVASATTLMGFIDRENKKLTKPPKELLELFSKL